MHSFERVKQLNDAAQRAGVTAFVSQFDNVATHGQYRTPYDKTAPYVRPGDRVLDWGCGNGHFSMFLESLGARVTGFSFEDAPAAMAQSETFAFAPGDESDPRTLPFADASFDAAVSVGVMEHVWETGGTEQDSLAELARVVRPGGYFFTYHLPNKAGWIEKLVKRLRLNKHFHQRKYDEREIRALWTAAGFSIVELGLYNALPRAELRALPRIVKNNTSFARAYDLLDRAITTLAPRVSTNFFIVARRS